MKVKMAFEALKILVEQGKGEIPLMFDDTRSGEIGEASVYPDTYKVTGEEDCGEIIDMDVETEYAKVYVG